MVGFGKKLRHLHVHAEGAVGAEASADRQRHAVLNGHCPHHRVLDGPARDPEPGEAAE